MLRNVPAEFNKEDIERLASKARVKYVINATICAYSPMFKDIRIETYGDPMGCRRGDEIEIKIGKNNQFELVQNLTLDYENRSYERNMIGMSLDENFSLDKFLQWRDAQLKNQKQR